MWNFKKQSNEQGIKPTDFGFRPATNPSAVSSVPNGSVESIADFGLKVIMVFGVLCLVFGL
jgi:hypothetical protein